MNEVMFKVKKNKVPMEDAQIFILKSKNIDQEELFNISEVSVPFSNFIKGYPEVIPINHHNPEYKRILLLELTLFKEK